MNTKELKKYIPLAVAVFILILSFVLSFSITKSVKLKKLRKTYSNQTTPAIATEPAPGENSDTPENPNDPENEPSKTPSGEDPSGTGMLKTLPTPETINMPTSDLWSVVLVNVYHKINSSYEPRVSSIAENILLDSRVAEAYEKMAAAAKKDGVTLTPSSGYVRISRQETYYNDKVAELVSQGMSEEEAKAAAAYTVAPPGCSEANCGLSVEFEWSEGPFEQSPVYDWLKKHAAEYGFIERYKAEFENETHVQANPAHWRYVGVDHSKYLSEKNISLEKYKEAPAD